MSEGTPGLPAGQLEGAFVPWIYSSAADVRQVSLADMASDAAQMASAVVDCAHLLKPAVVSVNLDPTVWASACGCEVTWGDGFPRVEAGTGAANPDAVGEAERVQVVLTAIERTRGALRGTPLACGIVGPATLAGYLGVSAPVSKLDQFEIGEVVGEAARLVCEQRVDLLVVMESPEVTDAELEPWLDGGHYTRIRNFANHFSISTCLLAPSMSAAADAGAELGGFDYIVGAGDEVGADAGGLTGVVVDGFGGGSCEPVDEVGLLAAGSRFLTTSWDVAPGTDLGDLQRDFAAIGRLLEDQ